MSLTVICPNARRCKVVVTPMKLLNEVLDEACLREGYSKDKSYVLKFHGRPVDLSLPFRLSGLPSNSALEMEEIEAKVDVREVEIALQMPDGQRISRSFTIDTTLHQILEQSVSMTHGSADASSSNQVPHGGCVGRVPCLTYMNKQWKGERQLQYTTLRSMGITPGSKVLLRYSLITMTAAELGALDAELERDVKRREALSERFAEKQLEKQRQEEMQQQFTREFDERQRLLQQAEREREERALLGAGTSAQAPSEMAPPSETPTTTGRLERLQAIYSEVNASIEENRDLRQDELEKWKYKLDILPESFDPSELMTQVEQPDFSDFKFPDYTPSVHLQLGAEVSSSPTSTTKSRDLSPAAAAERSSVFYRLNPPADINDNNNEMQLSDEFFDLTVEEARRMQRELREQARRYEELSFLSPQHVNEKNRELKAQSYRNAVIRFLLPQRYVIVQGQFFSREPCTRLFEFIRDALFANDAPGEIGLYVANKRVESSLQLTLLDADIAPKSTITVRVSRELAEQATTCLVATMREVSIEEANRMSEEWVSCNSAFNSNENHVSPHTQRREAGTSGSVKRGASSALNGATSGQPTSTNLPNSHKPKWFKK